MSSPVRSFLNVCVCASIAGWLPAQAAVVPLSAANTEGAGVDGRLLGDQKGKTQLIIDRALVGPIASVPIKRIVVRRDAHMNKNLPGGMKGGWIHLKIRASWTQTRPQVPSASFAQNHAGNPVVVFDGEYRVIDSPALPANAKVASFDPAVSAHIVLDTPIPPSSSGNLCLEFEHMPHATKSAPEIWLADAQVAPNEPQAVFGRSCIRKGHTDPFAAAISSYAYLGSTLRCSAIGPDTSFGFLILGASDKFFGPLPLPIDLTPFGAPGCSFYVSMDQVLPVVMTKHPLFGDSDGSFALPLPTAATLAGARIYTQWWFLDPQANAFGSTTTNGASIALAAVPKTVRVGVIRANDPTATVGDVQFHNTPVIKLCDR